jgi:outer membrane immunogenic protein
MEVMSHRALLNGLLVIGIMLPAPLLAADLREPYAGSLKDAPVYAAPFSWTGFYIGVHAGYGWGDSSVGDGGTKLGPNNTPPFGAFSCGPALTGNYCNNPFELEPEGWLGGVQLGANWQRGRLVLGVEGDIGYLGIDEESVLDRPFDDQDFASVEYGWYGTLTGRIGVALDRSLLYVKGGLAVARIEMEAADIDGGNIFEGSHVSTSDTQLGWALGVGLEHALSDRLSVKAEYLYMDFGSDTVRSPDGDIYEHEHQIHTAKIGLNYRLTSEAEPLK